MVIERGFIYVLGYRFQWHVFVLVLFCFDVLGLSPPIQPGVGMGVSAFRSGGMSGSSVLDVMSHNV